MARATDKNGEWSHWMAAAQNGDSAAYERLLRAAVPFVRAVVSRHHRGDRIEDVVQDVLLTVHRVRHTYDPARPFDNWLATIAHRRSVDSLRRSGRISANETHDEFGYETFADPSANMDLEKTERAEGLHAAIADLPDSQREAIELLKVREMTLIEAARASGKSVAALKVNVHRGIKTLRARLKGNEGD